MEESAHIHTEADFKSIPRAPHFHFTSKVLEVPLPHHALHSAQIEVGMALIQWHLWCKCEEV